MALSSVIIRKLGKTTTSASETLDLANNEIKKYIESSPVSFVTMFYGVLNIKNKKFTYASAGHPSAFLLRNKEITELESNGTFLGMYKDEKYYEKTIDLENKDKIILYTDGITECRNTAEQEFGTEEFIKVLKSNSQKSPTQLREAIFKQITKFTRNKEIHDDQTIVIAEID